MIVIMKMMPMLKKTAVIPGGQISPLMLWNVLNQPAQENLWRVKFKLVRKKTQKYKCPLTCSHQREHFAMVI